MSIQNKRIGFIGGGKMAEAIFSGLIKELIKPENIVVSDISQTRLDDMQSKYSVEVCCVAGGTLEEYSQVLDCDIIFLAIKPQNAPKLLSTLGSSFKASQLIVSIMGGIKLLDIRKFITKASIVRVMPNVPMLVGEGVAGIALDEGVSSQDAETVTKLFQAVGEAYVLPENMIDPLTGISGCGPAYAYMFIEALADGGVQMGLPRELAYKLAAQTLVGVGKMVLETGSHPGQLKDDVCSPGGSTIAGVRALEDKGFRGVVMSAVESGVRRMEEIGKKA